MTRRHLLAALFAIPAVGARRSYLDDFAVHSFSAAGRTKIYYVIGDGLPVIFLHELPGLLAEAFDFARRLNLDTGYSVYLPLFFGAPGQNSDLRVILETPCWGSEFNCRSRHSLGDIVDWVEHFCLKVDGDHDHKGVAVIGNCLTGAMPLALMARSSLNDVMRCTVVSQPALPLGGLDGMSPDLGGRQALGLSDPELQKAIESEIPVFAQKFTDDPHMPEDRLTFLKSRFDSWTHRSPGQFTYQPLPSDHHCPALKIEPSGHNHAMLTLGYCPTEGTSGRKAYESVRDFIKAQMSNPVWPRKRGVARLGAQ